MSTVSTPIHVIRTPMDGTVPMRRISTRNSSAPMKCRVKGRSLDDSLTRRVSRLDNALEDARGNFIFCTPRLARRQLPMTESRSNNAVENQLRTVYDRVEQRNNTLIQTHVPALTLTQVPSAVQAVQVFIDKMHQAANSADEQTKLNLTRALTNDTSCNSRVMPIVRQQYHDADVLNQLPVDDVACWYSVGKEIGRGTFGRVRLAAHRLSGTKVAIKSYARLHGARSCLPVDGIGKRVICDSSGDALEWRRVRQEVNVLSKLRTHPNVMGFVEVFETSTRIHVVTELVRGTSLCDVLRRSPGQRLTEFRAKRIFQQLIVAVEALHAQRVIHRDLKLENILLDEHSGHATIIDFGFSDFEVTNESQILDPAENNPSKKQPKKKTFCGTPAYMAPEVVASERYDGRPVDIWSLGVLLYVMLCGKLPFQGVSFHQLFQKLRSGAQQLVLPPTLSIEARALLQSVLTVDPAKRPSASELCCCPWLLHPEPPQLQKELVLSFEAWPGTHQTVCATLTELYGVQVNPSGNLDQTKTGSRRSKRLSAFLKLATAVSARQLQKIIDALPVPSLECIQPQQGEETEPEVSDDQKILQDVDPPSTRHKQQLEKLIGLVKTSLATS